MAGSGVNFEGKSFYNVKRKMRLTIYKEWKNEEAAKEEAIREKE
jgi:hypothetical protein